jgi:hypothetical protein
MKFFSEGFQIPDNPSLQISARDAHQRITASRVPAALNQTGLHSATITGILVTQHHESGPRPKPGAQQPAHSLFEVLFALKWNAAKLPTLRQQSRQQALQQILG